MENDNEYYEEPEMKINYDYFPKSEIKIPFTKDERIKIIYRDIDKNL